MNKPRKAAALTVAPPEAADTSPLPAALTAPKLLAMPGEQYVTEAFADLTTEMSGAMATVGKVVHDVTTPEGMEAAKAGRMVFRQLRWAIDRLHKDVKAPILQLGRLIDGRWNQMKDELAPYEAHYDAPIVAEEQRLADIARAREHAEMERIAGIERKVAALANAPAQALNQPASVIETLLIALCCQVVDEAGYAEYLPMAQAAQEKSRQDLETAWHAALQAEADQAELERLRLQVGVTPIAPIPWQPSALTTGDVLLHCYRYLIGLDENYDALLADVDACLTSLGYDLTTVQP